MDGKIKRKEVPYSQVSNQALRDENLSLKAKGLYALIQSYITIPNFVLYKTTLLKKCKEGKKAFESAWIELKKSGYLVQYRMKNEKGSFYYEYELLDFIEVVEETHTPKKEVAGFGDMQKGGSGKRGVYKKNDFNKNELNNKEEEREEQKTASSSADINSFEIKVLEELERAKFRNINKNTIKNIKKYTNSLKDLINAILYIEKTKKAKDVAILIALLRDKDYEIILEEKNTHKKKEQNRALFKNNEIKTIEIIESKEEKEFREKKEKLSTEIMKLDLSMSRRLKLTEELVFINDTQNFNLFLIKIEKLKAELEVEETV